MTYTMLLTAMLCVAADRPAVPTAFEFIDSAQYDGRSVLQYRAVELRKKPARSLGDRKFADGALYGLIPVGPKPDTALTVVWIANGPDGPQLWLDGNGDGQLADDERHEFADKNLDFPATVTIQSEPTPKKVERTLMFRRSAAGEGLRYAVRGYMQGELQIGDKTCKTLLIDGNANACFDSVGQDRVWIDLNQDGRFDPMAERFPLGKPINREQEVYVVRSDAAAQAVVANLRSAGQGKLRVELAKKLDPATKISAELVSDLGELVCIDKLDQAESIPFGEYRVSSLRLTTPDKEGQTWNYIFTSHNSKNYSVPTGGETSIVLFKQLKMDVSLSPNTGSVAPGQTVTAKPNLTADDSLELAACTIGGDSNPQRAEKDAVVLLLDPAGKEVTRGLTGFS